MTILTALAACQSDDEKPVDIGLDYLPLKVGAFQIYNVEEIRYTLGKPETTAYMLKVKIIDAFQGDAGDSIFVMHRSRKPGNAAVWTFIDTWSARRNNREAVINEENTPYVKFTLPVSKGSKWNGNKYNTKVENIYSLEGIKTTEVISDETFKDCITIKQSDNKDFIVFLDSRSEVYARGVGLVHKATTQLQYCTSPDCLGKQQVDSGIILQQSILSYGVE